MPLMKIETIILTSKKWPVEYQHVVEVLVLRDKNVGHFLEINILFTVQVYYNIGHIFL